MVAEIINYIPSFLAGILLGIIFYAGLWWTVKKGIQSESPALWFGISMLLRTAIVLLGFYLVGLGHWQRLMVCLLGFIIARIVLTLFIRSDKGEQKKMQQEGHPHAS
jgi:F1F0 ATPase subunit 2